MRRDSALAYGYDIHLAAIADPTISLGVPGGNTLLRFVDAVMGGLPHDLTAAQCEVIDEHGPEGLVDAASVYGNFAMMNRIAEGTGIPLARQMEAGEQGLIEMLGIGRFNKH